MLVLLLDAVMMLVHGAPPAVRPGRRQYGALRSASGTNCYGELLAVPLLLGYKLLW
jgi:hypothetical protein